MSFCMVLTTCDSQEAAQSIGAGLVKAKLAACAQMHPVQSIYAWKGEIHKDPEIRLIIKTREALYPKVEAFIIAHHSYEVPQVVKTSITGGLSAYLSWIEENTLE